MNQNMTVKRKFHVRQHEKGRKELRQGDAKPEVPMGRVPRIARLMALAIRFQQLIDDGVVADQAELARLGHVSRARLSQIMNLLNLAPNIQEAILFLPRTVEGRDAIGERDVRGIVGEVDWGRQRRMWRVMRQE